MKPLACILVVLHLLLTGCIVTYRGFPNATRDSLPKDPVAKLLSYHVEPVIGTGKERAGAVLLMTLLPGYYPLEPQVDPFGQPGSRAVGRTFTASGMFSDLIETQNPPEAGLFCTVDFSPIQPSKVVQYYLASQGVFLFTYIGALIPAFSLLPYYTDEGGTTVIYSLYQDNQLRKVYRYPIYKKGAGWIGLLPFAWMNYFTTDLADAVEGATLQFLIEAHRDGCFVGSPTCPPSRVAPKASQILPQPMDSGNSGQRIEESLQPMLKWDPFPGLGEDITYDLTIWSAKAGLHQVQRGSTVYERQGLTEPSHRIETALGPSTHYLWAVRSHFTRDGKTQVTPWTYEIAEVYAPPDYYHLWTPTALSLPQ
jgi:hypothetical protein